MPVIRLPLLYAGDKGERVLYTLFDSGINLSCINPLYIDTIGTRLGLGRPRRTASAKTGHIIEITEVIRLDFYLHDILLSDEFLVVPGLSEEALIGAATLRKWRLTPDYEQDTVQADAEAAKLQRV
ncbi:pepsin/retropepsin-like aspartic protease family protein [Sediminibacterium soli]|uniref:hypothetical protein n=1 Tax=Sediminibacterium soli TaxID=2698829 RepID=UPI00137ABB10|nr:hypothetical protein [Sediminibacterium soli]NCI46165.1 hypothetical protein [Sediminibacterium soli]